MKKKWNRRRTEKGVHLLLSIILFFCILGAVVLLVSRKITREMSESAVQNLSESLDLMSGTIEAILVKDAEFQKLVAQEISVMDNPYEFVKSLNNNRTMVKISLVPADEKEGISNTGETFSEEGLDFSAGETVDGLPFSKSYINYMGTWAYSMKCPVVKDGREIATLYIEYIYNVFDSLVSESFYNRKAMLYIMDSKSERFVLKPKGMGEQDTGHINLQDYYRANNIIENDIHEEVSGCIDNGKKVLFYHDICGKNSLNYMWPVNGGMIYITGYVPVEVIQKEGRTVNQNIFLVVIIMLVTFILCCIYYYFIQNQQNKARKEREAEREIHNKHLTEALQAAQLASNSKTTFLSNMSHDIRTPMNAVLGFTALLARDAENPDKVKEYTKKITASGQHLLSLINDILDVSKIESGKVVLNIDEFTLNDMVSSVDAIIRPMAKAKGQNFFVEVTGIKHEYLLGDETRINQILINLLSNAVKYTQEGGNIWFRIIGLKQHSSQYEHIRIEVQDDGYGMTPEYLETIFDAFTRAENSTTNKVQGTGLGMAITKNIVELMGGTIDVKSEVDKGSLFRVELEFCIPESRSNQQFWKNSGISRILVVDGDAESCKNIKMLMKDMGVIADTALSTEEALYLLQNVAGEESYNLVLLDCNIPDMGCIQMAEKIREIMPVSAPVLFLADYDTDGIEEALRIKNTGILTKPFFVSAFKEKIIEIQAELNNESILDTDDSNSLEGLHFLAAEDNEINAEILSEILSIEGAECEIVENGKLAVERFTNAREWEFDAILMDVQMPVMNGYDAARAIRALERKDAAKILIIAMTANAFAEDEREALKAGMDVHLAKPIDLELLKNIIKQCIKGKV